MAYKTLIFGVDELFGQLQPYYMQEVWRGNLEIVAYAVIDNNGGISIVTPDGNAVGGGKQIPEFELAILSSHKTFYEHMKFLEVQGFPRNRIIDGRVFLVPNLDFPRLIEEGVAYGVWSENIFSDISFTVYPRVYKFSKSGNMNLSLGTKSYVDFNCRFFGGGTVSIGKFSCLAGNAFFNFAKTEDHNYHNISMYSMTHSDFMFPQEFYLQNGACKIEIGNDVWIGLGSTMKCTNPNKPLVIGDGAVIAADSVVVKSVPPYAIVGGNPAQIIKYRFPQHVIDALLQIKWWDWSLDKIHDNFKYFNDVEKFISLHRR